MLGTGLVTAAYCFLVAAVMVWSSRVAKPRVRDRIIAGLPWRGDERVLDVGCGRGLFLIAAAKRLTTGRALGVDIWQTKDLSGNRPEATRDNLRAEGVADRAEILSGDARRLPFSGGSFDLVLSSLAIHNIPSAGERATAIREMVRVLKPGGRLVIFDIWHTRQYAALLREPGVAELQQSRWSLLWCIPTRVLTKCAEGLAVA
ncbi:MAG: class I SAM-dependent methyltransferase [Acidobacteria bacterium]|nr:class I SAM-dependent methyltransferase [Acidobacteriota bacterium]